MDIDKDETNLVNKKARTKTKYKEEHNIVEHTQIEELSSELEEIIEHIG